MLSAENYTWSLILAGWGFEPSNLLEQKSYYCEECGKSFSNGGSWYNHRKVHTGETMCKTCGKRFGTVSSLNRHMKNEHGY